jgi:hypothetical protein
LPERGEVDVSLTLQGSKPSVIPGPLELVLPLDIKGGPPVLLTLRANVQVSTWQMKFSPSGPMCRPVQVLNESLERDTEVLIEDNTANTLSFLYLLGYTALFSCSVDCVGVHTSQQFQGRSLLSILTDKPFMVPYALFSITP